MEYYNLFIALSDINNYSSDDESFYRALGYRDGYYDRDPKEFISEDFQTAYDEGWAVGWRDIIEDQPTLLKAV